MARNVAKVVVVRTVHSGRGDEILELTKTNLWRRAR
jgi:hypothetical protein